MSFQKNILNLRILPVIIIIATVIWAVFTSTSIFRELPVEDCKIDFTHDKYDYCNLGLLKDNNNEFLAILMKSDYGARFQFWNEANSSFAEFHLDDYTPTFNNGQDLNSIYSDPDSGSIYTFLTKNNADMYLVKYTLSNNKITNTFLEKICRHPAFDLLADSVTVINGVKFYEFGLINNDLKDSLKIVNYLDGYRILFKEKLINKIHIIPEKDDEFTDVYYKLVEMFQNNFHLKVNPPDILQAQMFHSARKFFLKLFETKDYSKISDFMGADIVGRTDSNKDGHKDLIIIISSNRFTGDILICYDEFNRKILWKREYSRQINLRDFAVADIDSDGEEEIIFGSYSPCSQPPFDYYSKLPEIGLSFFPYLRILDLRGNNKTKDINLFPQGGFYDTKFTYVKRIHKILIGFRSPNDQTAKKLLSYDFNSNRLDTLNIDYTCIRAVYNNGNEIMLINTVEGMTELIALNDKLELKYRKKVSDELLEFTHDSKVKIDNRIYYILKRPFSIYDSSFDCIYKSDLNINREFVQFKNNSFAVKSTVNSRFEDKYDKVSHLHFEVRKEMRKSALYVLAVELFLLLLYFFIRSTLFIPLPVANKNYLTLFTIFGFIHLVKTHGNRHLFVFSKRITKNKSELVEAIRQIDNTAKVISSKSFFLYKYEVYEISSHDEMLAIQIIAHDIKNNIANIKFLTERDTPGSDQGLKDTIKTALSNSVKLSNFTNLTKINFTKVNLEKLINKIIREFSLTASVDFDIRFTSENQELMIDEKKFEIVLRNLFQNSIDALSEDIESSEKKIIVMLEETGQGLNLTVSNKLNRELDPEKILKLGFTTKKTGTGTGLYIVKRIIENMKGEMSVSTDNGLFTVRIKLIRNRA